MIARHFVVLARAALLALTAASAFTLVLDACATDPTPATTPGGADAASSSDAATGEDGAIPPSTDASDAGDAGIVNGPGKEGAVCAFNRDCQAALRCECDETNGCACKPGVRGSGKNGIDPCTSGNACASSVCVEGPPDTGSFCSDECDSSAECVGKLPLCSTIAFVGRICIRQN